jgi:alkylhydroperoxidase family enzyme
MVALKTLMFTIVAPGTVLGIVPWLLLHWSGEAVKKAGETDERLFAVAAWREAPYWTSAERAALALTEAVTRLADRADPVPDEIWEEATRHYDEKGLAAIILMIAMTNLFNRVNVTIRQGAGQQQ